MTKKLNGTNPLSYLGVNATTPPNSIRSERSPSGKDGLNFTIGDFWIEDNPSGTSNIFTLLSKSDSTPVWAKVGTSNGDLSTLTGNTGGAVTGDTESNISLVGDEDTGMIVEGDSTLNTLTVKNTFVEIVTVSTTDATPTTLYSIPVGELESVFINANVIAVNTLFTVGISGTVEGGARREFLGATALIGAPVINISEDSAGDPLFDLVVIGNDLVLQVTGEAGVPYEWKANVTTVKI